MGQILTLHLVNDLGSDSISGSQSDVPSLWPGTPVPYDFTTPPQAMRPVWIGVGADGTTNQVYPIGTTVATIIGDGWVRVYQGTEIVGSSGDVHVFSETYPHIQLALSNCCATQINTAALALFQSRFSLDPDSPNPPCAAEAIFKWLAIRSEEDVRTLTYSFGYTLTSQDGLINETVSLVTDAAFTETVQFVKAWADDFPNAPTYPFGTLQMSVIIKEAGTPVEQDVHTYRLPGIDCEGDSSSASDSSGSSSGESASASASDTFDPDTLPGQFAWLADDEPNVELAGDDVAAWREHFGTGQDFVMAANRPAFNANGGANDLPYIEVAGGETLKITPAPINTNPFMLYAVLRTPTSILETPIVYLKDEGGSNGPRYQSNKIGYIYIGEGGFYSRFVPQARTEWQLLSVKIKDNNSLQLEWNDEPIDIEQIDGAGGGTFAADFLDLGTYAGLQVAELRLFDHALTTDEEADLKAYFMDKYDLQYPAKGIIVFGDSHTAGVQSGAATGTPYMKTFRDTTGFKIYNHGVTGSCADNNNGDFDLPDIYAQFTKGKWADFWLHFQYGTNDAGTASGGYGWTSWANWKASVKGKIQAFLDVGFTGPKIVIMTPPNSTGPYVAGNLSTVNTLLQEIATELGTQFYDWTADMLANGMDAATIVGGDLIHVDDPAHVLAAAGLIAITGT